MSDTGAEIDDWTLYIQAKKDIVYLYHTCESEGTFQNDLDYRVEVSSSFWRVLRGFARPAPLREPNAYDRACDAFLTTGCLLLICTHCSAWLDGVYQRIDEDRLAEYEAAVSEATVGDEDAPVLDTARRLVALCRQYGPTPPRPSHGIGTPSPLEDEPALDELSDLYRERIRNWHAYWTKRGLYG